MNGSTDARIVEQESVFARSNKNILFKMGTAIIKELFKSD
jgi:hypothetical protein